jgi:Family of unknown function (DUF6519)
MKGDFTRNTFDRSQHYSRVLMQQGRVQLDADWNEQTAILLHHLRALASDLIGPFGGPGANLGFSLAVNPADPNDFTIGPGHYYVDGFLSENDRSDISYFKQSDYPLTDAKLPANTYLVYLDVWERHITALEDARIREVALNGPDTATRAKVIWQVKVTEKMPDGTDISPDIKPNAALKIWPSWVQAWNAKAECRLKARLKPAQSYTDPCITSPDSKYRGQENQLYRVEIHTAGTLKDGSPTFKWSRDNGSIAAAWLGNAPDGGMIVSNARSFAAGQWIEITSKAKDLHAQTGQLVKIVRVEGDILYPDSPQGWDKNTAKIVRRWDQVETEGIQLTDGSEPIKEGTTDADWIDLENGLQVQFQPGGAYRTGDYWLIPARTAGTIGWPGDPNPDALQPFGIVHHYAPLWIISVAAEGTLTIDPKKDLRRQFALIK